MSFDDIDNSDVEDPGHAVETTRALVSQLAEGGGREVQREHVASYTTVGDDNVN